MPTDRGSASVRVKIDRQFAGSSCARTSVVRCAGGAGGCPDSRSRSRWEVHMCRAADAGRRDRTVTPRSQWLRKTFGVIRRHVLKPWMKPRSRKVEALCGIREMTKELTGDCTDRPPVTSHVTCPKLRSAPLGQPRACCHGGRASARARTSDKVTSSVVFGLRVLRLPGGAHTSPRSA